MPRLTATRTKTRRTISVSAETYDELREALAERPSTLARVQPFEENVPINLDDITITRGNQTEGWIPYATHPPHPGIWVLLLFPTDDQAQPVVEVGKLSRWSANQGRQPTHWAQLPSHVDDL